jgi:hypothetical protein
MQVFCSVAGFVVIFILESTGRLRVSTRKDPARGHIDSPFWSRDPRPGVVWPPNHVRAWGETDPSSRFIRTSRTPHILAPSELKACGIRRRAVVSRPRACMASCARIHAAHPDDRHTLQHRGAPEAQASDTRTCQSLRRTDRPVDLPLWPRRHRRRATTHAEHHQSGAAVAAAYENSLFFIGFPVLAVLSFAHWRRGAAGCAGGASCAAAANGRSGGRDASDSASRRVRPPSRARPPARSRRSIRCAGGLLRGRRYATNRLPQHLRFVVVLRSALRCLPSSAQADPAGLYRPSGTWSQGSTSILALAPPRAAATALVLGTPAHAASLLGYYFAQRIRAPPHPVGCSLPHTLSRGHARVLPTINHAPLQAARSEGSSQRTSELLGARTSHSARH